ncbi:hypothetical protein ACWZHB_10800 [Nocardia sp. FBN12]|uniref:hypothetical protein n=1 Tax=Nocardia sp. FBN12 TaxID=3419766 RepID=UPI003D0054F6
MYQQLETYQPLARLLPEDQRPDFDQLHQKLRHITDTVDAFGELLGPRNWVFHDQLSLDRMATLIQESGGNHEAAESALVAYYQEEGTLRFMTLRAGKHKAIRPRQHLINFALTDYEAGRYYAVVHVLMSVMDGFVNDVDTKLRKGLHAREESEVDAWDSVVGHHMGLTSAHATFRKGVYATDQTETVDLYRNGIVHGTLPNYNNIMVATKAWNRLFAVVDWALAEEKRQAPVQPDPTPEESLEKLLSTIEQSSDTKRRMAAFQPETLRSGDQGMELHPGYLACQEFLTLWTRTNYGHMPKSLARHSKRTPIVPPAKMRKRYDKYRLTAFEILAVDQPALAMCNITVKLTINDRDYEPTLRWIWEDPDGGIHPDTGQWRLYTSWPSEMMT